MYNNCFLPSKRFLLTIHNLTQTQLKSLDTLTDKAIKQWAGVTNVMLHTKERLNTKSISQLYTETHTNVTKHAKASIITKHTKRVT